MGHLLNHIGLHGVPCNWETTLENKNFCSICTDTAYDEYISISVFNFFSKMVLYVRQTTMCGKAKLNWLMMKYAN